LANGDARGLCRKMRSNSRAGAALRSKSCLASHAFRPPCPARESSGRIGASCVVFSSFYFPEPRAFLLVRLNWRLRTSLQLKPRRHLTGRVAVTAQNCRHKNARLAVSPLRGVLHFRAFVRGAPHHAARANRKLGRSTGIRGWRHVRTQTAILGGGEQDTNAVPLFVPQLCRLYRLYRLVASQKALILREKNGGHARNRTGVRGFAVRCVTTPPRGPCILLA
jgi:hypothetical protein